MDIKDSYLHGTVGVVKSISVSADKLKYTLADINNTAKTITLPLATKDANGLMSSTDKVKLDAFTSPDNYVKWDGTSAAYYNIFQKSNNSEGHVRAIFYDKDGNSVFGYGYNSSNKQAYITNYTYSKDLYLGNGILTYGGRTVAFIDSDIAADKLKKSVKLWG